MQENVLYEMIFNLNDIIGCVENAESIIVKMW